MGLFGNILRSQCLDVIEYVENGQNVMVHKYDCNGKEIMMGAQLTVRESQNAIFISEGRLADVFGPGRYTLSTANMPVMTALQSWQYGFNSPFKSDVYFVNMRQFLDRKWGTANPVMMRDKEFGMIRLRAFGVYSFRVVDPATFLKEVFGTQALFTVDGVEGQMKRTIVSTLTDVIAESGIPALDLAAGYDELGASVLTSANEKLSSLGVALASFVIENISLPEEVEKAMDRRTSMGVAGNLDTYTKYQAAEALREAANNPNGGMASMGAGIGAGAVMSQMYSQAQAAPAEAQTRCIACGATIKAGSKFCSECGKPQTAGGSFCPECGAKTSDGARFCPNCGKKLI